MRRLLLITALLALAPAAQAGAVVGGANASTGDWPWQVQLSIGPYLCGGSLVAPDRVVTAAHCTAGFNAGDITVYSGALGSWDGAETSVTGVGEHPQSDVSDPFEPPRYDLSVLLLDGAAPDGEAVGVVDVETTSTDDIWDDASDDLWVTGWGMTTPGGNVADTLQEADVARVSDSACAAAWDVATWFPDMVCAANEAEEKDACNGDSGGPLVARAGADATQTNPANWRLAGVVSWGSRLCGQTGEPPGVYARVGASAINAFVRPDATITPKPTPVTPPALSGTAAVGEKLTCSPGTWQGATSSERQFFSFADESDDEPAFRAVADAGNQYTVASVDAGRLIACLEVAENAGGVAYDGSGFSARVPAVAGTTTVTPVQPPPSEPPLFIPPPPPPIVEPPPAGTAAPRATFAGRSCKRRRCTIAIRATDDSALPLLLRARLVRLVRTRCRRGGRIRTCVRERRVRVTVTRLGGTLFQVRTPRLARGRYRLSARAVDSAQNAQRTPLVVGFRLR